MEERETRGAGEDTVALVAAAALARIPRRLGQGQPRSRASRAAASLPRSVSEPIEFKDLSPPSRELTGDDEAWLRRLQSAVDAGDHVIRTRETDADVDELVVYTDRYGLWRAGRYVGTLTFEGRRLDIR